MRTPSGERGTTAVTYLLFADDAPGRPASRALAEAKLAEIDDQMASLARARAVIEWGMSCTCPSIDACTCGIHPA